MTSFERKEMMESSVGEHDQEAVLENSGARLAKYLAEFKLRAEQDMRDPRAYLQSISYIADKIHFCADVLLRETHDNERALSQHRE